jgi:integrase
MGPTAPVAFSPALTDSLHKCRRTLGLRPIMLHTQQPRPGSVAELVAVFLAWADQHYRGGASRGEARNVRDAVRPLVAAYGDADVADFGARELIEVRSRMIAAGLARGSINQRCNRIRRVFRRGVEWGIVASGVLASLQAVSPLRHGAKGVRETSPVRPVSDDDVVRTLDFLSDDMRVLVLLMLRSGMRRGEAILMRTADLDTSRDIWIYRPAHHKTSHHGHDRRIMLDAECQALLRPLLRPIVPEGYLFSSDGGDTPYNGDSVYNAISRACARAGVQHWHPHQLRHAYSTRVHRATGSIEDAAAALGQRSLSVAQIYVERDERRALAALEAANKVAPAPGRYAGSESLFSPRSGALPDAAGRPDTPAGGFPEGGAS